MAPMERDGKLSVRGVQVGLEVVAFAVVQMPPLTVAMTAMSALVG